MKRTIEYYLSKGFDYPAAEYFANGRRVATKVVPNDDFSLKIEFDNGEIKRYDMKSSMEKGTVFEPLNDMQIFKRAYIDDCHSICWDIDPEIDSNIVWSNKLDLSSDVCYINGQKVN